MDEIVKDFLIESNENLDRLDQELVKLESSPSSKELLASVFRTIHTIKGSCGFLGFARLEKLAHAGESLLSRLRDGQLTLTADITSGLLAMVDAVRQMLFAVKASGQDGTEDYADLIQHLSNLQRQDANDSSGLCTKAAEAPPIAEEDQKEAKSPVSAANDVNELEQADPSKIGGVLLERGHVTPEELAAALHQQELGRKKLGEILVDRGAAHPEHVLDAQKTVETRNPESAVETIRVG